MCSSLPPELSKTLSVESSRLLAKGLPDSEPEHVLHGGDVVFDKNDPIYSTILRWIDVETALRCPDYGIRATEAYIAPTKRRRARSRPTSQRG
jgi:hypothetical protein